MLFVQESGEEGPSMAVGSRGGVGPCRTDRSQRLGAEAYQDSRWGSGTTQMVTMTVKHKTHWNCVVKIESSSMLWRRVKGVEYWRQITEFLQS